MQTTIVKKYSQAFKQQVVREYEDGASIYKLLQKYGVGSHATVIRRSSPDIGTNCSYAPHLDT